MGLPTSHPTLLLCPVLGPTVALEELQAELSSLCCWINFVGRFKTWSLLLMTRQHIDFALTLVYQSQSRRSFRLRFSCNQNSSARNICALQGNGNLLTNSNEPQSVELRLKYLFEFPPTTILYFSLKRLKTLSLILYSKKW